MNRKIATTFSELAVSAPLAAQRLLGAELIRTFADGQQAVLRIVETEAYDQTDAASHSYTAPTARTGVMFGPAGRLYVYFTYGMHYCMNVVCGQAGEGAAVLIRALEPLSGESLLLNNRPVQQIVSVSNGPAKACQALAINTDFNGHDLTLAPVQLRLRAPLPASQIVQTTRIGISQAKTVPWRFYIRDNQFVSKL